MTFSNSCPGTRTIRQPIPEFINCSNCGTEVEIWTHELKATCSGCGREVYRVRQVSCIDWCPYAKECVGPEVYERLRPGVLEDLSTSGSPLAVLEREHEHILEMLGLLRGAGLCLKLGTLRPVTPLREKGIEHLTKVLDFFEKDLRLHFRREEEVIFPALEKRIGVEKSPSQMLLKEHQKVQQYYGHLRDKLVGLQRDGNEQSESVVKEIQDISGSLAQYLKEHIRKENESLFPLAKSLIPERELEDVPDKLRAVSR